MTIKANEVKEGQEVKFGWAQWLKVERIETGQLKNGKEFKRFYGTSKQELTSRTKRTYPKKENESNDCQFFKSETKVTVR